MLRNILKTIFNRQDHTSLEELIEVKRGRERIILILLGAHPIIATILYVTYIWPVFFPADLGNSAVRELIASEYYRQATRPLYDELQRYNNRSAEQDYSTPSREFHFMDTVRGLEVHAQIKLVPRESVDVLSAPNSAGLKQFSYDSTFVNRVSEYYLRIYAMIMISEIAFFLYYFLRFQSERKQDEKLLERFAAWKRTTAIEARASEEDVVARIKEVLSRFHFYAKLTLQEKIENETKSVLEPVVQRAVHGILKLHFDDIRSEELVPSFAGGGSRIDLFLRDEKIGIEIKVANDKNKDRAIGEQLLVDIGRYAEHANCEVLLCFIYDPRGLLQNPHGLIKNLEEQSRKNGLRVHVVVSPM